MKFWPEDALRWYEDACLMFEYPKRQYGAMLADIIDKEDTVLDLGCGNGAASLLIAPWCKRVIALEQDEAALLQLEKRMKRQNISNIILKNDIWSSATPVDADVDVVVALHVHKALRSYESLSSLHRSVKKGGVIACPAATASCDESFSEIKRELGILPKHEQCENGCYTKGVLQGLGASVKCQHFTYEFGQPVASREEAIRFITWQLRTDESSSEIIRRYLDRYVEPLEDGYVVPITRKACGITFLK